MLTVNNYSGQDCAEGAMIPLEWFSNRSQRRNQSRLPFGIEKTSTAQQETKNGSAPFYLLLKLYRFTKGDALCHCQASPVRRNRKTVGHTYLTDVLHVVLVEVRTAARGVSKLRLKAHMPHGVVL